MRLSLLMLLFMIPLTVLHAQEVDSVDSGEEAVVDTSYQTDEDDSDAEITHISVDPDSVKSAQDYKNDKVVIRKFDDTKWKKIVGTTTYDEKPVKRNAAQNINIPWSSNVLRVATYILIAAVIILLIYSVIKNISIDDFKIKKAPLKAGDFSVPVENIDELNIYELLQQAIRDGNFKLAIRLYYLDLLKGLNQNGMIDWKKDKTNRDYLTELFLKNYYFEEVRKLTLAYEQVWYGEHVLTPEGFRRLTTNFESIQQNILNASKTL